MTSANDNTGPSIGRKIADATRHFFHMEASGGILLVIASSLAIIIANSSLTGFYDYVLNGLHFNVGPKDFAGGAFYIDKSMLHWINDGLMAVFFFLVGLEIKRELTIGALSNKASAILPVVAAVGGMIVPAIIYAAINKSNPETMAGWAIPCATDIAFALGVMSLLGDRVPLSAKILLTAIAIIDDLGAILIIALFYSDGLHYYALLGAIIPIVGLVLLNRMNVGRRLPYILLGIILWALVLKSGVHATMAGVLTALLIPVTVPNEKRSPAARLEHDLHPWVVFLILPLFGFANAGVPFTGMGLQSFMEPVTLGIILGLFIGKQLGVFGAMGLAIKSGLCPKPEGADWRQLYGVSLLCGIGFTMSLFIGGLAFTAEEMQASVRLGVLAGSLISAVAAYILIRSTSGKSEK